MAKKSGNLNNIIDVSVKRRNNYIEKVSINTYAYNKKMHYHDYYEVVITQTRDTERTFIIEDKIYKFNPKFCVNLSPPYAPHISSPICNNCRLLIAFKEEYGRKVFEFLDVDIDEFFSGAVYSYSKEQVEMIFDIGEKLFKEYTALSIDAVAVENSSKIKGLFAHFISLLANYTAVVQSMPTENTMEEIKKYLNNNYHRQLTLDEIAGVFYMNKFTMCRKFKEETGIAIIEYVTHLRLAEAKELLVETRFTIEEIARRLGYNSGKYFGKIFRKYENVSPDIYRKTMRREKHES